MIGLPWSNLQSERVAKQIWPAIRAACRAFPGSSAVEHPTVNRTAACSNQARGATLTFLPNRYRSASPFWACSFFA